MKTNILLVNICQPNFMLEGNTKFLPNLLNKFVLEANIIKPLTFPILAALTPEDYSVEIKNCCRYQDIPFDGDYDLVGLSCLTEYSIETYKIADEFRNLGITVVLGGMHATALPEEAKQHADSVVIGEAEYIWTQLLNDFKNNQLKPFYSQKKPVNPKHIPIIKKITGKEKQAIQATRGCPYGCKFCAVKNLKFGNIFRVRPINDVVEEIKSLKEKFFFFYDNSLTINPIYTKQLFREMKGLNKIFTAMGNIDVLGNDEEFLKLANEAGCIGWFVGFESVSQNTLIKIGKNTNRVKEYTSAVNKVHNYNMSIDGSFIFGFDSDTKDVFQTTLEAIKTIEIDFPLIGPLIPYPGTALFEKYEKEGRLLTRDWSKYVYDNVVFKPKNMSAQELFDNCKKVHRELYTIPNVINRIVKSLNFGINVFSMVGKKNITFRYTFDEQKSAV